MKAHAYVVYKQTYVMQGILILAFIVGFVSQIIQKVGRSQPSIHADLTFFDL